VQMRTMTLLERGLSSSAVSVGGLLNGSTPEATSHRITVTTTYAYWDDSSRSRISRAGSHEIVHGKRRITTDTALRLARYFGTSERFWLNLQDRYDIEVARDRLGTTLDEIRPLAHA
jgi:hypothetical protein